MFFLYPWLAVLGIGIPISAVVATGARQRAQTSAKARFAVCFVFACTITPTLFPWSNGHSAGGAFLYPAVLMLGLPFAGDNGIVAAFILGLLPIGIVAFILFRIWTRKIKKNLPP